MSSSAVVAREAEPLVALAARLEPRLRRILARYRIPPHDCEDLLQTALITTLRKWETVRDPEGWLIKTVVNQCLMYWRGRRRRPESPVDADALALLSPPVPSPEGPIVDRRDAERRLARLPARCRRLFLLRFVYGFSAGEIAELLGRRVSSVYSATRRCLRLLDERDAPGDRR